MPQMESPPGPETMIDGRRYLYFAGTAYLGLQSHPEVVRAACEATERFGVGAATSRTLAGDTPPAVEAERRAAAFFGTEDAFHVASGFMAPAVATALLAGRVDHVLIDEHAHVSLRQAAGHLGVPVEWFAHRDAESLALAIRAKTSFRSRLLVMTDGVFSADGSIAPLEDYWGVLAGHGGAVLLVDDAHGFGVLGENGRGTLEHAGLARRGFNREPASRSPALWACGTLSKALGGFGGILPGSRAVIERIKRGTPYGAAASGPPVPVAAASARALAIAIEEHNETAATPLTARFFERRARFEWHPGMLLPGATMQVSFFKDLATQRNTRSAYTFLAYLADRGRLADFINLQTFFPLRSEFADYLGCCASLDANLGRSMGPGERFTNPAYVEVGWVLEIPARYAADVAIERDVAGAAAAALVWYCPWSSAERRQMADSLLAWWGREGQAIASPTPLLSGHDLIEGLGLPPGPAVGATLRALVEAQVSGVVADREEAWAWARAALAAK